MNQQSIKFDRAADFYDQTRGFPPGEEQAAADVIFRAGQLIATSHVFEVGVGTGRIALPLSEKVRAIVGADLSRPMMDRLREKQNAQPIHLSEADATRLPFASHVFDAVITVDVLHLVGDWRTALDEIARVLRPNAPLIYAWGGVGIHDLRDVWNSVIPRADIGIRFSDGGKTLAELAWQPHGEPQIHKFTYEYRPGDFVASLRGRMWSGTWKLSDQDLARGVDAVEAYIRENYHDPDAPVTDEGEFQASAYLPPK